MISEINAGSSMAMQAIKLLAQYQGGRISKEGAVETVASWMDDAACNRNPHVALVAGIIYTNEGNYVEALKACHSGFNLEA